MRTLLVVLAFVPVAATAASFDRETPVRARIRRAAFTSEGGELLGHASLVERHNRQPTLTVVMLGRMQEAFNRTIRQRDPGAIGLKAKEIPLDKLVPGWMAALREAQIRPGQQSSGVASSVLQALGRLLEVKIGPTWTQITVPSVNLNSAIGRDLAAAFQAAAYNGTGSIREYYANRQGGGEPPQPYRTVRQLLEAGRRGLISSGDVIRTHEFLSPKHTEPLAPYLTATSDVSHKGQRRDVLAQIGVSPKRLAEAIAATPADAVALRTDQHTTYKWAIEQALRAPGRETDNREVIANALLHRLRSIKPEQARQVGRDAVDGWIDLLQTADSRRFAEIREHYRKLEFALP